MEPKGQSLTALYSQPQKRPVKIAHRGACGLYPENTVLSMRKALEYGADMIEFDLRMTKDRIPVLLHDYTIDRTSNGTGKPEEYTLTELRKLNFSCTTQIYGPHLETPVYPSMPIPTFEDILENFHGKCCMNIQVYDSSEDALKEICRLFRKYDMFDFGFLAMSGFEAATAQRAVNPDVEVAVLGEWSKRATVPEIRRCKQFGCRFIQPPIEYLTQDTLECCRELDIYPNVFYSDKDSEIRSLAKMGVSGILSNRIDILSQTLDSPE